MSNEKVVPIPEIPEQMAAWIEKIERPLKERIATLTAEVITLKQQGTDWAGIAGTHAGEIEILKAEIARRDAPVTVEELTTCLDEKQKVFGPESIQAWFDRLILARSTPPQSNTTPSLTEPKEK